MARWTLAPRLLTTASAVVAVLSSGGEARADARGQSVAVLVEGAHADEVAVWLEDRVKAPDTLKEGDAFRLALRSKGALPLRAAANNAARDAQLVTRAQAAARDAGVDYAILVEVQKTRHATRVHVWHIDAQRGVAVIDSDVALPTSATTAETVRAINALAPPSSMPPVETEKSAIADATIAPAPPPSSAGRDVSPEADMGPASAPVGGPSPVLAARAELGVGMRHFSYVQRISPDLRPYDLDAAPVVTVAAEVYPLSFTRVPVLKDFGITGDYGTAFALASEDSTGAHVGTSWQFYDVGVTQRIPLTRALLANVLAGYGGNDFQFTQSLAGGAAALPSVAYRFVRVGADLRYRFLSAFSVYGGGSYLDVLSSGYTAQLFPRESVGGVEGHLGAAYSLARNWEVSVNAAYTRMFYSFNPVPGDSSVAGGALDEQTRILAGFSYLM
jgi:hypothetical protein